MSTVIWLMKSLKGCSKSTRSTWPPSLRLSTSLSTRWTAVTSNRTKLLTTWPACSASATVTMLLAALPRLCLLDHQALAVALKPRKSQMLSVSSISAPRRFSRPKLSATHPSRSSYRRLQRTVSPSLTRSFSASSMRESVKVIAASMAGSLMASLRLNLKSTFSSP